MRKSEKDIIKPKPFIVTRQKPLEQESNTQKNVKKKDNTKEDIKVAWEIITLREKLLEEHPEDANIIEAAYIKTIYAYDNEIKSDKDVYLRLLKEVEESFIRCIKKQVEYSLPYPMATIADSYPNLKKNIYEWAEYTSLLITTMEIDRRCSVYDALEDDYYEDDEFWEIHKKLFPNRVHRTGKTLRISDKYRAEYHAPEIDLSQVGEMAYLILQKYLEQIGPIVIDKINFMNVHHLKNDIEILNFAYKTNLSDEELLLTPLWKKVQVTELTGSFIDEGEEDEINAIREAADKAEAEVQYVLSWLESSGDYIVVCPKSINAYTRKPCINLYNSEFRDESQQIDHILIGTAGIFAIETKCLGGRISIDSHGNWSQTKYGEEKGVRNPSHQVTRHAEVIKSILGENVPIISIICIANDKCIIEGQENCVYPIVKADLLANYIKEYKSDRMLTRFEQSTYKAILEEHQI